MKKYLILFTITFVSALSGNAQKLIALDHNGTSTFHMYLDSAMYYAQNGDWIYLPGGTASFSNGVTIFTVDKAVNLVGIGYHPDSSVTLGRTQVALTTEIINTASGGSIEGIWFNGIVSFGSPQSATNSNVNNYMIK